MRGRTLWILALIGLSNPESSLAQTPPGLHRGDSLIVALKEGQPRAGISSVPADPSSWPSTIEGTYLGMTSDSLHVRALGSRVIQVFPRRGVVRIWRFRTEQADHSRTGFLVGLGVGVTGGTIAWSRNRDQVQNCTGELCRLNDLAIGIGIIGVVATAYLGSRVGSLFHRNKTVLEVVPFPVVGTRESGYVSVGVRIKTSW